MTRFTALTLLIFVSSGLLVAEDVSSTYVTLCSHCHGADGSGNTPLGRALKLRDLHSSKLSALELATIIAKGTDRGRMPGFEKKLGTEMIVQLAAYVHKIDSQPPAARPQSRKAEPRPEPSDVKSTYTAKCAHCHGADGSGNTILGRRMELRDMRSREVQQFSDEQLAAVIAHGMDRGRMPGYEKKLGPEAVGQLASYVRNFVGGSSVTSDAKLAESSAPSTPPLAVIPAAKVQQPMLSNAEVDKPGQLRDTKPVGLAAGSSTLAKLSVIVSGTRNASGTGVIDLNSASKEMLMALPGITEADAARIIDCRPYKSSLQFKIRNIIAPEKYSQIADRIVAKQGTRRGQSATDAERKRAIGTNTDELVHY